MKFFGILVLGARTFAATASADTFDFTLNLSPFLPGGFADSGNGTITANLVSGDEYLATSVTGSTALLGTITGLLPVGNHFNNDLLFYPTTPYLDGNGLGLAGSSGDLTIEWNSYNHFYFETGTGNEGTFTLTRVSTVPEPGTISLIALAGFLVLIFVRRKRLVSGAPGQNPAAAFRLRVWRTA